MRGMCRGVRKSPQRFQEFLPPQGSRFSGGLACNHLSEARSRRDRGYTTLSPKSHFCDTAVGNLDSKLHDITADRMLQTHLSVRVGEIADVSRILEMVKDGFGVTHGYSSYNSMLMMPEILGSARV
jgi:hypothetical protein